MMHGSLPLSRGREYLIERVRASLTNPVWGVWFGRKGCIPAAPLLPTVADTLTAAVTQLYQRIDPDGEVPPPLDGYLEQEHGDVAFWNDDPVSFAQRRHRSRPVKRDGRLT